MKISVKMPICVSPHLIDIRVAEGDRVSLGDILFSYESDGALLFEYSACSGTVSEVTAVPGRDVGCGDTVITVNGDRLRSEGEMFPQSDSRSRGGRII